MTTLCFSITSDCVITFWYCHLHVLILELIPSKSALNQRQTRYVSELRKSARNSAYSERILSEITLFSAEIFSSEQLWFTRYLSWSDLKHRWSVLMFITFSESALKNVKNLKHNFSALIFTGKLRANDKLLMAEQRLRNLKRAIFYSNCNAIHSIRCVWKLNGLAVLQISINPSWTCMEALQDFRRYKTVFEKHWLIHIQLSMLQLCLQLECLPSFFKNPTKLSGNLWVAFKIWQRKQK